MTDNVISLVDVLAPPNSTQPTLVPLADVMANGEGPRAYPNDFVERLPDAGPRRPVLLTAVDGGALPYRALTERHLIAAFRQAGLEGIPAVVIPRERIQLAVTTLSEHFRSTKDPLERAWICDTVTDLLHENQEGIADRLGISRWTLRRYRSLLDLHPVVLRLLVNGKLGLTHALACSEAPSSGQAELALVAAECALSGQQTRLLAGRVRQCPDTEMLDLLEEMLGCCPQMADAQPSADTIADVETPEPAVGDAATTSGSESRSDGSGGSEAPHDTQDKGSSAPASGDVSVPVIPSVDVTRYTSQLKDGRRKALEQLAHQMQLDPLTVRRASLLLIADPRLVVPSAVAYAQHVSRKELGRAVAQMELALARMRAAATEGMTPNERKVLELVLHHVPLWAEELMSIIQETPTSVAAAPGRSHPVK